MIYRDGCDMQDSVFRTYSVDMGYITMTIYVKNPFGSSTTKQK